MKARCEFGIRVGLHVRGRCGSPQVVRRQRAAIRSRRNLSSVKDGKVQSAENGWEGGR